LPTTYLNVTAVTGGTRSDPNTVRTASKRRYNCVGLSSDWRSILAKLILCGSDPPCCTSVTDVVDNQTTL